MNPMDRREFLLSSTLVGLGALGACATPASGGRPFDEREGRLLSSPEAALPIVQRGAADAAVLRARAREVPAGSDLEGLKARMEATMDQAGGVGLAGPQIGLSLRVVLVKLDYKTDSPHNHLAVNPLILARSDDTCEGYEGCLSIADVGGLVRRNRWIRVRYEDERGRGHEVEAEGANAVLWQHELDHLDGVLYVDRLLGELLPMEEVRRLRKEAEARAGAEPVSLRPGGLHLEGWLV